MNFSENDSNYLFSLSAFYIQFAESNRCRCRSSFTSSWTYCRFIFHSQSISFEFFIQSIVSCTFKNYIYQGVTYESLEEVFQSYPVDRRNTDQTEKLFGKCVELSGHREIQHIENSASEAVVTEPCYSYLQNCRFDKSMEYFVQFCVSVSHQWIYINVTTT